MSLKALFIKNIKVLTFLVGILSFAFITGNKSVKKNDIPENTFRFKFDSFVQKVIKETNYSAGFSVTVVKDNKVLFSKGYGLRDVKNNLPMTNETPIYIASATKSFVGTLAKILADEGVLELDAPIKKYLPELNFKDPLLSTETITIRDLLTHRSGIENIPVVLRTAFTGEQNDSLILKLFDNSVFKGKSFRYTNLGYVLTGLIINKVTGKHWQDILDEKIFKPLNMNSTHAYVSKYQKSDLAQPYRVFNGIAEKLDYIKDDKTMHAAGGIITSAKDAANWLIFNINSGEFNSKKIISTVSINEIHSAQIDLSKSFYNYKRFSYGLGWYLSKYNGDLLIHHFGGYEGFRSHISYMPEFNIGVAGFVNDDEEGFNIPDLVADYAYNLLTGKKDADKIADKEFNKLKETISKNKKNENKEQPNFLTQSDIEQLIGNYFNEELGDLKIIKKDKKLVVQIGNLVGEITKKENNFLLVNLKVFKSKVKIENDKEGKTVSISLISIPWKNTTFIKIK